MSNSSYAAQLLDMKPLSTTDLEVARLIARAAIERDPMRFRFSINHDTRGPKYLACPLEYDWQRKDHVGIETGDRKKAEAWLVRAAALGYLISEVDSAHRETGPQFSIAIARRRAEYHQRPRPVLGDDDDIPF